MSDIPYNYRKYIDDVTKMTQRGHISSGEQQASPSSAGSRGLAKVTQFTNNKTQMQLGQESIAESMVDIRSIMNRIDGVNVPVSEDDGDERAIAQMKTDRDSDYLYLRGKEIDQGSIMYKMEDYSDGIFELQGANYADGTELDEKELEELESTQELIDWVMIDFVSESAVQEDAGDEAMAKEIAELYDNVLEWITDTENAETDDEAEYGDGYTDTDYNDATDLAKTFREKGMQAGLKLHKELLAKRKGDGFSSFSEWDPLSPETELNYAAKKILARQKESAVQEDIGDKGRIALEKAGFDPMKVKEYMAVFNDHGDTSDIDQMNMDKVGLADAMAMVLASHDVENESTTEDSGELARLKELSGLEEDAGLTDQQKQGLQAIYKKYGNYEGYGNGDSLPIGNMGQVIDPGSTLWADDKEYKELDAYMKKMGYDGFSDAQDKDEDFFDNAMKEMPISSAMQDDISKVLGNDYYQKPDLAKAANDYMNSIDESYQPMPEGDEFDIAEDEDFEEVLGALGFPEDETDLFDAEYQGRKVPLNKPMRGDVKKFKVYVKDPSSGNVKKVNFGHGGTSAKRPTMRIRKSNPKARKSFRARHNCANPGPKTKARYWSCRKW